MPHPPFTCLNILERLREKYDERQRKERDSKQVEEGEKSEQAGSMEHPDQANYGLQGL